jgi:hypothetical protein
MPRWYTEWGLLLPSYCDGNNRLAKQRELLTFLRQKICLASLPSTLKILARQMQITLVPTPGPTMGGIRSRASQQIFSSGASTTIDKKQCDERACRCKYYSCTEDIGNAAGYAVTFLELKP